MSGALRPLRPLSSIPKGSVHARARVIVVGAEADPAWLGPDRVVGRCLHGPSDPAFVAFDLPRPSVVVAVGWTAEIASFVSRANRPSVVVWSDDPGARRVWAAERARLAMSADEVATHVSTLIREEMRAFIQPSELLRWYAHDVRNALFGPSMGVDALRTTESLPADLVEDVEAIDEGLRRTLGLTYAMSSLGVSWARSRTWAASSQVGLAGALEDAAALVGVHAWMDAGVPFDLVVQVPAGPPNAAGPFDVALHQLLWLVKLQIRAGTSFTVDARAAGRRVQVEVSWTCHYPFPASCASFLLDRAAVLELKHRDLRSTPMGLTQLVDVVRDLDGDLAVDVAEDRVMRVRFDLPRAGA